jgi:hypothetical protein
MTFSRADLLAAAQSSLAAAGARDREGWVGLFASGGRVEDPVGSQPHQGRMAITRFYDTFIGPRDVGFSPDVDIVVGSTVIRDLTLEIGMSSRLTLRVPAYLRYDLQDVNGDLKITALYAFWELPTMMGQFLRGGIRSVSAGLLLSKGLLTNQGLIGTLGFLRGFRGAGPQAKRRFREFLTDARAGDEVAVRRRLTKKARITTGNDVPLSTSELLTRLAGARPRKLVGAGHHLVVGLDRDGHRDVLAAEVAAKPFAIKRIRYFCDHG